MRNKLSFIRSHFPPVKYTYSELIFNWNLRHRKIIRKISHWIDASGMLLHDFKLVGGYREWKVNVRNTTLSVSKIAIKITKEL